MASVLTGNSAATSSGSSPMKERTPSKFGTMPTPPKPSAKKNQTPQAPKMMIETMILLFPDMDNIEENAKQSLLKHNGVLSVGVHAFDALHTEKKGIFANERKRWYANVTFNNQKVSPAQMRESLAVFERIAGQKTGMVTEKQFAKLAQDTEHFSMTDSDEESASTKEAASGSCSSSATDDAMDELREWYGGDSESEEENEDGAQYGDDDPTEDGASKDAKKKKTNKEASYLHEDEGKIDKKAEEEKKAVVGFFNPMLGMFGMQGGSSFLAGLKSMSLDIPGETKTYGSSA